MKSMTAYGYGEFQNENYLMTMELKSYNNRFLEIGFFAPPYLSQYEAVVTETIKAHAQRGHVDVSLKVKNIKSNVDVSVDTKAAEAYLDAFRSIKAIGAEKHIELKIRMSDVIAQDGVLSSIRTDGIDSYREGLDYCSAAVMKQFDEAKSREGEITCKDLKSKLDSIAKSLETVKKSCGDLT